MRLDAYFKFERLGITKSKTRLDLTSYSSCYDPIFNPNKGQVWIYLQSNDYVQGLPKKKACLSVLTKTEHLSSIFIPDTNKPELGFGDVYRSADAILFIIQEDSLEIFIAKGKKRIAQSLYYQLVDGELDLEIEALRKNAVLIKT